MQASRAPHPALRRPSPPCSDRRPSVRARCVAGGVRTPNGTPRGEFLRASADVPLTATTGADFVSPDGTVYAGVRAAPQMCSSHCRAVEVGVLCGVGRRGGVRAGGWAWRVCACGGEVVDAYATHSESLHGAKGPHRHVQGCALRRVVGRCSSNSQETCGQRRDRRRMAIQAT